MADIALSEAQHLKLCLTQLRKSNFNWGSWPIHTALWEAVSPDDDLLDRIFIVHRYLEGSGLDAGDTLLRRLNGMVETAEQRVMKTIHDEEIGHVAFGSYWFKFLCKEISLDPEEKLKEQITRLRRILPKRVERIAVEPRIKAGFSEKEIQLLDQLRQDFLDKKTKDWVQ